MNRVLAIFVFSLGLLFAGAGASLAQTHPPMLQVTGAPGTAAFSLTDLDALPQKTIVTSTPWHDGKRSFAGPLLRDVLKKAGVDGATLKVTALNDYSVEFPAADLDRYGVVLASRMDGKLLAVRDKGPLFVMYPFDDDADLKQEKFYSRAVWQVAKISIR